MILTEVAFTKVKRGTTGERRVSHAKIHLETRPFDGGSNENGPTTPTQITMTTRPTIDEPTSPRSPLHDRYMTNILSQSPLANEDDLVPQHVRKNRIRHLMMDARTSMTPSPKKNNQTDSPNTNAVIKRLVSRCCMLQKIKTGFEECVRTSEREWESVIGTEHLPWASEHIMIEFKSEGNPRLHQFSDILNELVTIENEVVNLLEEVIEYVCTCIRRYSKRYNGHDNLTSKQFFRRVINSSSFKNSLSSKLACQEETFDSFGRNPRIHRENEELDFCPSSFEEEELLLSGKLQLEYRSKLVESCKNIMEELSSCKHPLMQMRSTETLEHLITQMENVIERHCRLLRQMKAIQSGEDADVSGTSSSSPSGDHMFEMDEEDDQLKVHERQEREELEEQRYMTKIFNGFNKRIS